MRPAAKVGTRQTAVGPCMNSTTKPSNLATKADAESLWVRPAVPGDLDALVVLEQRSFDADRISRDQYRRHLRSDSALVLIAASSTQPEQLLGSALVFFRRTSAVARLYSLAVQSQARGRGIGVALLEAATTGAARRGCRALRLEVRTDNGAAIRLYERRGFVPIGRINAYYEDGADALRYELALI